jgi:hypothetical protein
VRRDPVRALLAAWWACVALGTLAALCAGYGRGLPPDTRPCAPCRERSQ